jgi:hypothetical protein
VRREPNRLRDGAGSDSSDDDDEDDEDDKERDNVQRRTTGRERRVPERLGAAEVKSEDEDEDDDEEEEVGARRRGSTRGGGGGGGGGGQGTPGKLRVQFKMGKRRRSNSGSEVEGEGESDGSGEEEDGRGRGGGRESRRHRRRHVALDDDGEDDEEEDVKEEDADEGKALVPAKSKKSSHKKGNAKLTPPLHKNRQGTGKGKSQKEGAGAGTRGGAGRAGVDSALSSSRTADSFAWLLQDRPHPGTYVPQWSDALVYIPQGHAQHLESRNNKFAAKPWNEIPGMRYVEPVRVVGMSYAISQDGRDETVAALVLRLADPAAASFGRDFEVELPQLDDADFLIPAHRCKAAASKGWRVQDRCAP